MVNFNPSNRFSKSYPPNSIHNYLAHPSGANEAIQIALEPEFTGGTSKSLKYLSLIENLWFDKPLGNFHVKLKHLKK